MSKAATLSAIKELKRDKQFLLIVLIPSAIAANNTMKTMDPALEEQTQLLPLTVLIFAQMVTLMETMPRPCVPRDKPNVGQTRILP